MSRYMPTSVVMRGRLRFWMTSPVSNSSAVFLQPVSIEQTSKRSELTDIGRSDNAQGTVKALSSTVSRLNASYTAY